jgi:ABC-type uncharacterized transport system involved in gliding motility auxiliary subunit
MSKINQRVSTSPAERLESMDLPTLGQPEMDAKFKLQKELLDAYEAVLHTWLARVKSEIDFWSDLAASMQNVRSIPEALGVYQQSLGRRVELAAEDARRMLEDSQNALSIITRATSKLREAGDKHEGKV